MRLTPKVLSGLIGLMLLGCNTPTISQKIAPANTVSQPSSAIDRASVQFVAEAPASKQTEIPLQAGQLYQAGRQRLLNEDWQPNLQGDAPNLRDSTVKALYDLGYQEIKDCSGTGEGFCLSEFVNPTGVLSVVTVPNGSAPENRLIKRWWVEKRTLPTRESNSIADGYYALGHTGQGLEVRGQQFRYYDEEGKAPWRPILELKSIRSGLVFDGQQYWCLMTLAPKEGINVCSAEGWVMLKPSPSSFR